MTSSPPLRATFPGTFDGAADAATWLRGVAAHERLPDATAFAMEVCLEELATNVARHGRDAEAGAAGRPISIGIALRIDPDAVDMVFEDNGVPFDTSRAPARPIREPIEELAPGGLGMQLIRSFSSALRYEPVPNGNRVVLKFLLQAGGASRAMV